MVLEQLPNVKYVPKKQIEVAKKRKPYDSSKRKKESAFEMNIERFQEILLNCIESGAESIMKKKVQTMLGISDKSNFNKLQRDPRLTSFMIQNSIAREYNRFVFNRRSQISRMGAFKSLGIGGEIAKGYSNVKS